MNILLAVFIVFAAVFSPRPEKKHQPAPAPAPHEAPARTPAERLTV